MLALLGRQVTATVGGELEPEERFKDHYSDRLGVNYPAQELLKTILEASKLLLIDASIEDPELTTEVVALITEFNQFLSNEAELEEIGRKLAGYRERPDSNP